MRFLRKSEITAYEIYLRENEYASGSVELYVRGVQRLADWLGDRPVEKSSVTEWKEQLFIGGLSPATVNSLLSAVNRFFRFVGWDDCCVKLLRIQKRFFSSQEQELTREEYVRLIETAEKNGQERLALLIESICATGIRVSEVKYLTVDAARCGRADISMKGKIRSILLPGKLCRKLLKYAKRKKITSGEIFLTRNGNGLSRKQIWAELKALSGKAGVGSKKVFPHNLRHLFARRFYRVSRDIAKLADILGHSNIETTRIYLISSGYEHMRDMERMRLLV